MGSNRICYGINTVQHDVFAMLMDAFQDSNIRYILMAIYSTLEPKVQTDVLDELLYADDMDKNASSEPSVKSHSHVITMISQSAQKDRGCTPISTW